MVVASPKRCFPDFVGADRCLERAKLPHGDDRDPPEALATLLWPDHSGGGIRAERARNSDWSPSEGWSSSSRPPMDRVGRII